MINEQLKDVLSALTINIINDVKFLFLLMTIINNISLS